MSTSTGQETNANTRPRVELRVDGVAVARMDWLDVPPNVSARLERALTRRRDLFTDDDVPDLDPLESVDASLLWGRLWLQLDDVRLVPKLTTDRAAEQAEAFLASLDQPQAAPAGGAQ